MVFVTKLSLVTLSEERRRFSRHNASQAPQPAHNLFIVSVLRTPYIEGRHPLTHNVYGVLPYNRNAHNEIKGSWTINRIFYRDTRYSVYRSQALVTERNQQKAARKARAQPKVRLEAGFFFLFFFPPHLVG